MDTTMDTSTVLTVSQAAHLAGVSSKTIRRWLHSGRLEAGRAGEAYVITITAAALKAAQDWTPSMDNGHVLSVTPGRVQSTSTLSSDLLDRLERQAERIGRLRLSSPRFADSCSLSKLHARRPPLKSLQEARQLTGLSRRRRPGRSVETHAVVGAMETSYVLTRAHLQARA